MIFTLQNEHHDMCNSVPRCLKSNKTCFLNFIPQHFLYCQDVSVQIIYSFDKIKVSSDTVSSHSRLNNLGNENEDINVQWKL